MTPSEDRPGSMARGPENLGPSTLLPPEKHPRWSHILPALERLERDIRQMNKRFGLVAAQDLADSGFFQRHIMDSLLPWPEITSILKASGRSVLHDLGSGAGLPGIPLGLLLGDLVTETVLIERRAKRATFLMGELPPLRALVPDATFRLCEGDALTLSRRPTWNGGNAMVVFRAYQQTSDQFLRELAAMYPPGTPVCAWKGAHEQTRQELRILEGSLHAAEGRIIPLLGETEETGVERSLLTWNVASPIVPPNQPA